MTRYLDSSAQLKRYIEEPDSSQFTTILGSDEGWLTCRIAGLRAPGWAVIVQFRTAPPHCR